MALVISIIVGILALILLILSSQIAVKKVLDFLHYFGLSSTFGGLVIFSLTTSFPEIISHLVASFGILSGDLNYKIASATVLGANIGSDVIQQTLVVGIVILIMGVVTFKKKFLMTAYLPMIGTTLMCLLLGWDRTFSRIDGLILLLLFGGYMIFVYEEDDKIKGDHSINLIPDIIIAGACFAVMIISAHFLLSVAEDIVLVTGLGGSLIGVISLGVASASPELVTAIFGLKEKAPGLSLGTLIGSNIINPLVAIGSGALISTYWVPKALLYWDLPMETITAALLLGYLWKSGGKLGRKGAIYLIGLYVFYLIIRISFFAFD